ncbi:UNVERIFIED_CONTAM: hypothetical protein FKN15_019703 [Acipenser sinensis]
MAASAKKNKKKGKTLTLTDFLAEDSGSNNTSNYPPVKPTSWADETDDLEGDVSTSWHTEEDTYRAPAIDRSILPTAPRAAREPNVDRSRLPRGPPYTAFLGNLPYDVSEESIKEFFRGLNISAVRLPREPSNPERLKGFGYAEFDDVDSILRALTLNEENLGNRRIRVDIADQSQEKEREDRSSGWDRDRNRSDGGPDKTDGDWRARPSADSDDAGPRRGGEDSFGEKSRDRFDRDGPHRDDRYEGGRDRDRFRDRYDDRDRRDYDKAGQSVFRAGKPGAGSETTGSETATRRRESERSVENEVFNREEDPPSPGTRPPPAKQDTLPLKVVPAPPPKENAWVKRPTVSGGSSDQDPRSPVSPGGNAAPSFTRKDSKRDRDSKPAPEPKKYEESPIPREKGKQLSDRGEESSRLGPRVREGPVLYGLCPELRVRRRGALPPASRQRGWTDG